jgi:hypothetical protein
MLTLFGLDGVADELFEFVLQLGGDGDFGFLHDGMSC